MYIRHDSTITLNVDFKITSTTNPIYIHYCCIMKNYTNCMNLSFYIFHFDVSLIFNYSKLVYVMCIIKS